MKREYTALFLFCGLGGGALGFVQARSRLFGHDATFRSIGGVDIDPGACADFEYLTKSPALCADLATLTPGALREFAGPVAPDVVFGSAPCKSFSGLTDPELAASPEYVAMARLYLTAVELCLSTWDLPPRLFIAENVPRILSKGAHLVDEAQRMLREAGFATEVSSHDCGELGGLAQHRRRALLVARDKKRVSSFLYQPPKRKVRACGEVLGELPLPETPSAGPMHRMPRIGWLTWVRLALIPAGGDHRDLPGALEELQKRREAWGRHHIEAWTDPSVTVAGDGSNGAFGVSDPRVDAEGRYDGSFAVSGWQDATWTVVGHPGSGGNPHVADPRVEVAAEYANSHPVNGWGDAARTVAAGASRPVAGGPSIADPRTSSWHPNALGVLAAEEPAGTVTTQGGPTHGRFSVSDPRVLPQADNPSTFWNKHRVSAWQAPTGAVTGATRAGSGAPSVADPRTGEYFRGSLGVIRWSEPTGVITSGGNPAKGRFTVADVRYQRPGARRPDHCLYVLPWADPSFTVHGKAHPGTGAYSVIDPRITEGLEDELPFTCEMRNGAFGILSWEEAAKTITAAGCIDNGPFAIADVRAPEVQPLAFIDNPKRSPFVLVEEPAKTNRGKPKVRRVDVPVVIIAEDGTWHRPMTPLELARLQDLPATVDGEPLKLAGDNVGAWVERIGNAVPVGTAQAIAEQMLTTLLASDVGAGLAPSGGAVWVRPEIEHAHAEGTPS